MVSEALAFPEIGQGDLDARTVLVGLIGAGIRNSRTPAMHEAEGRRLGLHYVYRLLDTSSAELSGASINQVLEAARSAGFAGVNVTHPFKQAVAPCLDEIADLARRIGAVNTVIFEDGRSVGHNTDHWGFAEGFREELDDAELRAVLQVGAGGAGAAVARALVDLGVRQLFISDIEETRAQELAEAINTEQRATTATAVTQNAHTSLTVNGIVNTSPVGMTSHPGIPVSEDCLKPGMWIADIVYFPLETALLRTARARGCRCLSGRTMAVYQAVRAFELFTGLKPDANAMKATFDAFGE